MATTLELACRPMWVKCKIDYRRQVSAGTLSTYPVTLEAGTEVQALADGEPIDFAVQRHRTKYRGDGQSGGTGYLVITASEDWVFLDSEYLSDRPVCSNCEEPLDELIDGVCPACAADG